MRVVDLTHTIWEGMSVYPGTDPPKLRIANTLEEHGFIETMLNIVSHTGTHMDTPGHLLENRIMLDDVDASFFVTKALVIDASDLKEGQQIPMEYVNRVRDKADKVDTLLFRTDWDRFWSDEKKYFGEYPVIDQEIVQYVIDSKKKSVGFDVMGIDPMADDKLIRHKKLFNAMDIMIIENLTKLEKCGTDIFLFAALPLKYKNSDGAPIRAVGILDVI